MTSSLHIALVVHGWPPQSYGGVGLYVESLAIELQRQGHTVTILAPSSEEIPSSEDYPWGTLHKISFRTAKNWKETWLRPKEEILSLLPNTHFDVLHVHHLGQWPISLPLWIQASKKIITLHDYAIICSRGQLYRPKHGICLGPEPQKCSSCIRDQLIHIPQSTTLTTIASAFPKTKERIKQLIRILPRRSRSKTLMHERINIAQQTLNHADLLLSPSRDLIDRYQSHTSNTIVHHPLPLLSPLHSTPLPSLPYRFVFASSIIPTKGAHLALQAIQQIPDAELWFAGSSFAVDGWPNYEKDIFSAIEKTTNAQHLGNLPHHQIPNILKQSHCLILPSLWPENSPIIIREALSMGLEIICAQEGGSKELSKHIHLIPNNSLSSLIQTMKNVMNSPKRNPPQHFPSMKEHVHDLYTHRLTSTF